MGSSITPVVQGPRDAPGDARLQRVRRLVRSWRLWGGVGSVVGALALPSSASAANARGIVNLYAGPAPYYQLLGGTWPNGYLRMNCWFDWAWAHGTNRWFSVTGLAWSPYTGRPTLMTGFANANQVANQQRVPHCR
jgi:hypothetical protein